MWRGPTGQRSTALSTSTEQGHDAVVSLVPSVTDRKLAADLKRRIIEAYEPILKLLQEADASGFEVGVMTGKDGLGRHVVMQLKIVKTY